MNAVCQTCKHSARCVPNQEEYMPVLFQTIARQTEFNFDSQEALEAQMQELRQRFLEALPEGCEFKTPERRKMIEVHWQIINDELQVKLLWPKFMMGSFSIGSKRV